MKYFLVSPIDKRPAGSKPYVWSTDNGDGWVCAARGIWRNKHAEDVVLETAEASHVTELDWTKTLFWDDALATGWLSRDGRFYGCPEVHHDVLAYCVLGMKVPELERLGWARVHSKRYVCEQRLTEEQKNWLSMNGIKVYD